MDWLPIETAPKIEGIEFLVYLPLSDRQDVVEFWPDCGFWNGDVFLSGCTHWMSLPPPPTNSAPEA